MKTIEERANEYVGHPADLDESLTITLQRGAFIQGAKSEHEELTRWHDPKKDFPETGKDVIIKYASEDGERYTIGHVSCDNNWDCESILIPYYDLNIIIGWREIHE